MSDVCTGWNYAIGNFKREIYFLGIGENIKNYTEKTMQQNPKSEAFNLMVHYST